jgi:S1-C subfamily serine protease
LLKFVHDLIIEAANVPESLVYQEQGQKNNRPAGAGSRYPRDHAQTMHPKEEKDSGGWCYNNKPAKRAGIEKGDVIVAMDGKPVKNIYDYMYRLEECKPGQRINVDVAAKWKNKLHW